MLGGGTFVTAGSEILPGSYINFVSAARAAEALVRGIAAIPYEWEWCAENEIITVEKADAEKDALTIFGYGYDHVKMINIREAFKNANTLLFYRLNATGVKATNTFATAVYSGIRGNDLKIVIAANVDIPSSFDVKTLLDDVVIDSQTVTDAAALVDNDFVTFKTGATLVVTAGLALADGTNGEAVTGTNYTAYLAKLESYSFNVLGCPIADDTTAVMFDNFTKRMRDQMGVKFQLVRMVTTTVPDYEGVIVIPNAVTDAGAPAGAMVYWATGAESACPISESLTNANYDGEYTVNVNYTQTQLKAFITAGKLAFHRVGKEVHILTDINSLTTFTDEKKKDFASNQAIRVLDYSGNGIASIFNTQYIGKIPNIGTGRTSFWSSVVNYNQALEKQGAIVDFDPKTVVVGALDSNKRAVVLGYSVQPTINMEQLYATVVVQ